MSALFPATLINGISFDASLDDAVYVAAGPASLGLSGWWSDYPGTPPWTGTASAGTSATHPLVFSTSNPTAGSPVNGHVPAVLDGISQWLWTSPSDAQDFFDPAGNAGTIIALVNASAYGPSAGAGLPYDAASIVGTYGGGYVIFGWDSVGFRTALHDGAYEDNGSIAVALSTWVCLQMKWNGTNLKARVNGGAWQTIAAGTGTYPGVTEAIALGTNYAGAAFFPGQILDVILAPTALPDGTLDSIRSYYDTRYGVSV
jgi:hypothetical protein